jgi:transposase-like protein
MYGYTSKWKIIYMCRHMVGAKAMWTYLYRAVDSTGATINFLLSETRDLTSARRFFQKALAAPGILAHA